MAPIALLVALTAAAASAQELDINDMALQWSRGRYASPVICEIDGEPISGVRRLMISPGPRHVQPMANRILFSDLEAEGAKRCFDPLGRKQPNIRGKLDFRLDRRSRPDLAQREFSTALRRNRGFDFDILKGVLRIEEVGGDGEPRDVDFAGGTASLHAVQPGSDTERLLSPFPGLRRMRLVVKTREGEQEHVLPLFMTAPR